MQKGREHEKIIRKAFREILEDTPIFISHGDCPEDAQLLAKIIREEYGREVELITLIGSVIGAHAGPGTLALFFRGTER